MSRLFLLMLRFRVAAMIWLFFLLAAGFHTGLAAFRWSYLWSMGALAASYVAATSANDVADRDIDLVNHLGDRGRPLVTGEATERDLRRLHGIASVLAVACAVPVGLPAVALVVLSLTIGRVYSLPPIRLSYRTFAAPVVLGVAYVLIPYLLGVLSSGTGWSRSDWVLAAALYALFTARIVLKDFRDREGDATFGRPTLLLRAGVATTCMVSLAALVAGDALLIVAIYPPTWLAVIVQVLVGAILARLRALATANDPREEQVAIGLGARLGNGLLLTVLAWLIVSRQAADPPTATTLILLLAALFVGTTVKLARHPEQALIGYKG
jgi:4-hydroxybenzoate polyprenyltransferase